MVSDSFTSIASSVSMTEDGGLAYYAKPPMTYTIYSIYIVYVIWEKVGDVVFDACSNHTIAARECLCVECAGGLGWGRESRLCDGLEVVLDEDVCQSGFPFEVVSLCVWWEFFSEFPLWLCVLHHDLGCGGLLCPMYGGVLCTFYYRWIHCVVLCFLLCTVLEFFPGLACVVVVSASPA